MKPPAFGLSTLPTVPPISAYQAEIARNLLALLYRAGVR